MININLGGDRAICVSHITRYPSDTQVRHIDDVLARKVYVMHLLFFIEKHFWTDIRLIYFSMNCQKCVEEVSPKMYDIILQYFWRHLLHKCRQKYCGCRQKYPFNVHLLAPSKPLKLSTRTKQSKLFKLSRPQKI